MDEKRNLWLFFLIAYAWSWLFWIPRGLLDQDVTWLAPLEGLLRGPLNPAAMGPFVAAFGLTFWRERWAGVVALAKRGVNFRFAARWYLVIFLLFPLISAGALFLAVLAGETMPPSEGLANPALIPVAFIWILLFAGPLQEEFGWRGYALDRLQVRWNAFTSSLILGLGWSLWHLPLFWVSGSFVYQVPIWGFVLNITLATFLFTSVHNNTGGSVLAALLFHTMQNLSIYVFPSIMVQLGALFHLLLQFAAVITVLIIWGSRTLVRQEASA